MFQSADQNTVLLPPIAGGTKALIVDGNGLAQAEGRILKICHHLTRTGMQDGHTIIRGEKDPPVGGKGNVIDVVGGEAVAGGVGLNDLFGAQVVEGNTKIALAHPKDGVGAVF